MVTSTDRTGTPLRAVILLLAGIAGCTAASGDGGASPRDPTGTGPHAGGDPGGTGAAGSGGGVTQPGGGIAPGLLTAGTWDDNLNFDYYLRYLTRIEGQQVADLPIIPRRDRLEILVTDGAGAPLGNARVRVTGPSGTLLEAPTRSDGRLFFFPGVTNTESGAALQVTATFGAAAGATAARAGDARVTIAVPGASPASPSALDLALVIDTTGSMGDELEYLKVEVSAIATKVAQSFPGVAQHYALILYRDLGDEYVVRSFDFTPSLETFQTAIRAQSANGGGDWPEAPEKALAKLTGLSWGQGAAARMAFWIADAPHHSPATGMMVTDILSAQGLGVRLYPIAASGVDDLVEYTMRTAAQVTGGRYLFLTDDSGIGNSHQEPTIPCYAVTALDKAMFRMISMELTGAEIHPDPADVIRTSGSPANGRCTLSDGQVVSAL